jgi:hypothetical protein
MAAQRVLDEYPKLGLDQEAEALVKRCNDKAPLKDADKKKEQEKDKEKEKEKGKDKETDEEKNDKT